ncbi:Cof-type HAD-IIB family hydrolase [Marinomonas agarivorans]|nr:Cof-type HAD-IIB family hydrolase [Marinomonas agarivorans]
MKQKVVVLDELLVFDLDGTLLGANEALSPLTRKALNELDQRGINWTIATGRMPHSARKALTNIQFKHSQVYKNGVLVWDLNEDKIINKLPLSQARVLEICKRLHQHDINPWLNTLDHEDNVGAVIAKIQTQRDKEWQTLLAEEGITVQEKADYSDVTDPVLNVFAATHNPMALNMAEELADLEDVAVFAGHDMYHEGAYWMDVHHASGTKGDAVKLIQEQSGAKKIICFGDSDNDVSMFEMADECYAMGQGLDVLKAMATKTIGANTEDGIAHFLAQRYDFLL